jgi:uncharacterized OsmC-like protein
MYADRRGWPLESVMVRLEHQKSHAKDREGYEVGEGRIEREVRVSGPPSDEQRGCLLEMANLCPVHRSLQSEAPVATAWLTEAVEPFWSVPFSKD